MFLLPESTIINRVIPESTLFSRAVRGDVLKSSFREQIQRVYWRHKLSADSYGLKASGYFKELEIFEILLTERSLDKRILRAMDKAIPYYLLHVLSSQGRYQALIAEKSARNGKIRIDNYVRSCWMEEDQLQFLFEERDLDKLNSSLKHQIDEKRGKGVLKTQALEECDAFLYYFKTMRMTRSYKPVLILAVLEHGGSITVDQAADCFIRFYQSRAEKGLPPEFGKCVYADSSASRNAICSNLIQNPIAALCHSGFFEYHEEEKTFSILPEIYDSLSLDSIDAIIRQCKIRLSEYFSKKGME